MELKDISLPVGVLDKDLVSIVKDRYPKYDKTLHSKCKRGSEYGILLRPDAIKAICTKFDIAPQEPQKPKKQDNRTFPCRISCRISQAEFEQLQLLIRNDGFDTMQDWLSAQIRYYLERCKNAENNKCPEGGIPVIKAIVGVQYKDKKTGKYGGRTYNYFCELPVAVGDIVSAPTAKGESVALISEINVPEDSIDEKIFPLLKTITSFAKESEV